MTRTISISTGDITLEAELNHSATADAVWDTLPYETRGNVWGDELYFTIPEKLDLKPENGQEVVELGDLGYWPVGNAFCIFYGPTPASTDERPRPASPVTVFGKVVGDATRLRKARAGVMVYVGREESAGNHDV